MTDYYSSAKVASFTLRRVLSRCRHAIQASDRQGPLASTILEMLPSKRGFHSLGA